MNDNQVNKKFWIETGKQMEQAQVTNCRNLDVTQQDVLK